MNAIEPIKYSDVQVLIAEDSPTQAERLKYVLERHGYRVSAVANGRRAIDAARADEPTLILSDVVMPEMDGYALCREIKADALLADLPVILVTTLADPQDVIRAIECGADYFVLKPYNEQFLLSRIQFVLQNQKSRSHDVAGSGVEVFFNGHRHFITADRQQILNLLLSTYEAAIQRNQELSSAQSELQVANASLESANKELESFSYSVSHDLRAPLRHINGFADMLRRDSASNLSANGQRYLQTIADSAEKMDQLIGALLGFSRISRSEINRGLVKMDQMVAEVIQDLANEIGNRAVEWKIDPLPEVSVDRVIFKQVWVNLLSNAVKYTRHRQIAKIHVSCFKKDSFAWEFCVRDNGAGFDAQHADNSN